MEKTGIRLPPSTKAKRYHRCDQTGVYKFVKKGSGQNDLAEYIPANDLFATGGSHIGVFHGGEGDMCSAGPSSPVNDFETVTDELNSEAILMLTNKANSSETRCSNVSDARTSDV